MKKILYLTFVITVILIIMHSCNKDKTIEKQGGGSIYSPEEMSIWYRLIDFKNKIDNPLKTDDYISQDSVVWYIETLLNSTEVYSDSSFTYFFQDSTNYQIPVNSDSLVNMNDISTVYYHYYVAIYGRPYLLPPFE